MNLILDKQRKFTKIDMAESASVFLIHFSDGIRAINIENNMWSIEPLFLNNNPLQCAPFTKDELRTIARENNLTPLAFQRITWNYGAKYSNWTPITEHQNNHLRCPGELWSNIASNLCENSEEEIQKIRNIPRDEINPRSISEITDTMSVPEKLAFSISISARAMGNCIERISDFYHENLIHAMYCGLHDGDHYSISLDDELVSNVHSFFLHLAAARDYIFTLSAARLGLNTETYDSLAKVCNKINTSHIAQDPILEYIFRCGIIHQTGGEPKYKLLDWLDDATKVRNNFVHKSPFGLSNLHGMGSAEIINADIGLYRYKRCILHKDSEIDIFRFICYIYKNMCTFLKGCADASGYNASAQAIQDRDIISIKMTDIGI